MQARMWAGLGIGIGKASVRQFTRASTRKREVRGFREKKVEAQEVFSNCEMRNGRACTPGDFVQYTEASMRCV